MAIVEMSAQPILEPNGNRNRSRVINGRVGFIIEPTTRLFVPVTVTFTSAITVSCNIVTILQGRIQSFPGGTNPKDGDANI